MKIEQLPIKDIKPYKRNAKKHDERQIKNVMQSIKNYDIVQPLVVDKDNVLIIGHCRLIACKRLGITEVPVVRKDDLTQEDVDKLRLLDNKLNESEWDFDLLLEDIPTLDFSDFDIDWGLPEEQEEEKEIIEDEAPEPPTEPKAKVGDLWLLGNSHRLICGDSTDVTVIDRLMDGVKADLVVTDPPYNVNYTGGTKDALKILNDKMDNDSFRQFLRDAFASADSVMRAGAVFYIWHADSEGYNFRGACADNNWKVRQCLIWNKSTFVLGRQDYQWKHEPCLYGWKDGAAHYFIDDRKQSTVIPDINEIVPEKMKKADLLCLVKEILSDKISTTVICEDKPSRSEEHPTMKPVKLIARQIKNSSLPEGNVLDIFGGSGTTLIACEQLNRKCYMCELDPHYIDVIIQRYINLKGTDKDVFLIRDGKKIEYKDVI